MRASLEGDKTVDYSTLNSAYRKLLSIVVQNAFYASPTQEQKQAVAAFLECALSHIREHEKRGVHQRHVQFLTEFYNEADDMLKRVGHSDMKAGAEAMVMIKSGPVSVKKFMTNTINSLYTYIVKPEKMPSIVKLQENKREVNHFPIVQKLNTLFGEAFFSKYDNAKWESYSGTHEQGTVLELRGVIIPQSSVSWFEKRLNGKCRFEFVPCAENDSRKILRILDAEGQLAKEAANKILSDRELPERKAQMETELQQRGLNVNTATKDGWSKVLVQVIISGQLEPHGIDFTDEMQRRVQQLVIEKFDALYSSGVKFRELPPAKLNEILLDVQHQFILEYRQATPNPF